MIYNSASYLYSMNVLFAGWQVPRFCKQYGHVGEAINQALSEYKQEVKNKVFPGISNTPYKISEGDVDGFMNELQKMGLSKAASAAAAAVASSKDMGGRE